MCICLSFTKGRFDWLFVFVAALQVSGHSSFEILLVEQKSTSYVVENANTKYVYRHGSKGQQGHINGVKFKYHYNNMAAPAATASSFFFFLKKPSTAEAMVLCAGDDVRWLAICAP